MLGITNPEKSWRTWQLCIKGRNFERGLRHKSKQYVDSESTSCVDNRVSNLSAKAMVCLKEFVSVCLLIAFLLTSTSARKDKGKIAPSYILIHYSYSTDRMGHSYSLPFVPSTSCHQIYHLDPFYLCKECKDQWRKNLFTLIFCRACSSRQKSW